MAKKKQASKTNHEKLAFPKGASLTEKSGNAKQSGNAALKNESSAGDYYKLKKQAVEDLVTASPENSPPVSKAELRKYHAAPGIKISDTVKAILIKFWFAGVICYFFVWGLSTFTLNQWDLMLILSIALGGITHLITNNVFRFIAKKQGDYDRWMMFPGDSHLWLVADLLYAVVLVVCTMMTYSAINTLFSSPEGEAALGVEPILFGIIITVWDLIFLFLKALMKRIVSDAKRQVSGEHR